MNSDICIVGGAGHIGLPLGLAFAAAGQRVVLYDINEAALDIIRGGRLPFIEYGADEILPKVLNRTLSLSSDASSIAHARVVIVTIGTPVDEYLNPKLRTVFDLFDKLRPQLHADQTLVIRSTVYPGTCRQVAARLGADGSGPWKVAYCPERIVQGWAIKELRELPQLVSGVTDAAREDACALFSVISPKVIPVSIEEAELAKLFSNAWRYIQFAASNQFYMISELLGVDYNTVRQVMVDGYGRNASLPSAGFAAGPCLLKDTMQLFAFHGNFQLGQAAMNVNEGLPNFIVDRLQRRYDLAKTTVGILGMTFKADIDDIRDSLSYKLGKVLRFCGATVLYSDEFATDPTFIPKEELVRRSQVVIVGVPHTAYRTLSIPPAVDVIDLWQAVACSR
jgi:UDP-N-acetyl-D-mannosaminuronic acid dehydrogenase